MAPECKNSQLEYESAYASLHVEAGRATRHCLHLRTQEISLLTNTHPTPNTDPYTRTHPHTPTSVRERVCERDGARNATVSHGAKEIKIIEREREPSVALSEFPPSGEPLHPSVWENRSRAEVRGRWPQQTVTTAEASVGRHQTADKWASENATPHFPTNLRPPLCPTQGTWSSSRNSKTLPEARIVLGGSERWNRTESPRGRVETEISSLVEGRAGLSKDGKPLGERSLRVGRAITIRFPFWSKPRRDDRKVYLVAPAVDASTCGRR